MRKFISQLLGRDEKLGAKEGGTTPEMKEEFHQQWELISFVQVNGRCTAISTAALCVPAAPFETIMIDESQEVDGELRLEGMDTLIFKPDSRGSRYGSEVRQMEEACGGHYEEILYAVSDREWQKGVRLPESLGEAEILPDYRVITFVYKPVSRGWVVVETECSAGVSLTRVFPKANKAAKGREVQDNETLYYDKSAPKGQGVLAEGVDGLQAHLKQVTLETEANLGRLGDDVDVGFDRVGLLEMIG